MKKSILLIISLFAGIISTFAQMMPDSTVQVVAYWKVGDKVHYQSESRSYTVAEGDTTITKKSAGIFELEVVAADEEKGYRLKATSMDFQNSDPLVQTIDDKWRERFGASIFFETDPYGTFERIVPFENLEEQTEALIQETTDALMKKVDALSQEQALALVRSMFNPETIINSYAAEYAPLFFYHGARLGLADEYPIEDEAPSLFGEGNSILLKGSFWVDEDLTDDFSVVIRMFKEADEEQLAPFIKAVVGQVTQPMIESMVENDENKVEIQQMLDELYDQAKMSMEDFMVEEIHLDSGWPIKYIFERKFYMSFEDMEQEQWTETRITLIDED